jgi:hypothetical protein
MAKIHALPIPLLRDVLIDIHCIFLCQRAYALDLQYFFMGVCQIVVGINVLAKGAEQIPGIGR